MEEHMEEHMAQQATTKTPLTILIDYYADLFINHGQNMKTLELLARVISKADELKEIEKHQHGVTWDAAIKAHDDRGHVHARSLVDFDEYYNDTFKH